MDFQIPNAAKGYIVVLEQLDHTFQYDYIFFSHCTNFQDKTLELECKNFS